MSNSIETLVLLSKTRGPLAKLSDGSGEVTLAISAAAVKFKIPSWMVGKRCRFKAVGAKAQVIFGGQTLATAPATTYDALTTVDVDGVLTVNAATGRPLSDGETDYWLVPLQAEAKYATVIASGAGFLHIGLASKNAINQGP